MGLGLNRGNDQELNKKSSSQIALKWFTQEIHAKNPITISAQKLYTYINYKTPTLINNAYPIFSSKL